MKALPIIQHVARVTMFVSSFVTPYGVARETRENPLHKFRIVFVPIQYDFIQSLLHQTQQNVEISKKRSTKIVNFCTSFFTLQSDSSMFEVKTV